MSAINVVRFRVKPGREQDFIEAHKRADPTFKGFQRGSLVDTGNRTYCFVGEWVSFEDIVAARPQMVGLLDTMRDMLEDQGNGLGLTDPVSGTVIQSMP
jgi:hypothetical protein